MAVGIAIGGASPPAIEGQPPTCSCESMMRPVRSITSLTIRAGFPPVADDVVENLAAHAPPREKTWFALASGNPSFRLVAMKRLAATFVLLAIMLRGAPVVTPAFECFAVSDLEKVFEDGHRLPAPKPAVDVFGLRDEFLSGQIVIRTQADVAELSVAVEPPVHETGSRLPPGSVSWNFVGSVPVPENTPDTSPQRLLRPAPARFPDYLREQSRTSLAAGTWQAVWLTIHVPADAVPGVYSGRVVLSAGSSSAAVQLRVEVLPLTLPKARHLMVTNWFRTRGFDTFHATGADYSDRFFEILAAYAAEMASHRQNVFSIPYDSIRITQDAGGTLAFDFEWFDRWAKVFWDTGHMDLMELGFTGSFGRDDSGNRTRDAHFRSFRARREPGGEPFALDGADCLPQLLPALQEHLRTRGWLAKSVIHVIDEPKIQHMPAWRAQSAFVRSHAPEIRRIDAIETTDFHGDLEVWVPKLNHLHTWFDDYKRAQELGNELWYYTCMHPTGGYPNRFIDFPLIDTRILHWLNYRFGITGYLHHGLNKWTANPFELMNEARFGAGDSWIVYPARDGLMGSIRWEQMRAGIQDYEYFRLLEDRLAGVRRGAGLPWLNPAQRGIELAARVIPAMNRFTQDPDLLYAVKRQVAGEIMALETGPRLVVQTWPAEGSSLIFSPANVDLRGWVEPGSTVSIDGREILVEADGSFVANLSLRPDRASVRIQARKGEAVREVTRTFSVSE